MNIPDDPHSDQVLRRQLLMTKQTWRQLEAHGVGADTQLRLDFFYNAPNRAAAEALQQLLLSETDYEVRVVANRDKWSVRGQTQATQVDERTLLEWVSWMVTAGLQHRVVFDGWGAAIPNSGSTQPGSCD
jgi:hypothetical protein